MNTIIEKIRAEIERLRELNAPKDSDNKIDEIAGQGYDDCLDDVENFLSSLEESEKPTSIDFEQELYKHFGQVKDFTLGMQIGKYFYELGKQEKPTTAEGLEEEYKDYVESDPVYSKLVNRNAGLSIARHFAQWGAEHRGSSETPNDLEEAAKKFVGYDMDTDDLRDYEIGVFSFKAGAKWQKEQMMKEAVEGTYDLYPPAIFLESDIPEAKHGQKVKLIIVKEDGK